MVIPCYKVAPFLPKVLASIGPEVSAIYCVIDGCEMGSDRAALAARLVADGHGLVSLREQEVNLETAFLELTRGALARPAGDS